MSQFVIDMPGNQSGLRTAYPAPGDTRLPLGGRVGPVRSAWPFLVNSSPQSDKPSQKSESGEPSDFAS